MCIRDRLIPVADLETADGVWLVSSARGVAPVSTLNGRPRPVPDELTTTIARYAGF